MHYLVRVAGAKVEGHECEPDDAGGVHGESDELCFVEVFRYFSRLDGVHRAHGNQHHVVHLRKPTAS